MQLTQSEARLAEDNKASRPKDFLIPCSGLALVPVRLENLSLHLQFHFTN